MKRETSTPAGTVQRHWIESEVLTSNMLGDPTRRMVDVYIPHGHDGRALPLLVDIVVVLELAQCMVRCLLLSARTLAVYFQ